MKKITYEEIKQYIESFGYELLSDEYINAKEKIKIKCNNNHIYESSWNRFKSGRRCPYCSKNKKHTQEEVEDYFQKYDYKLLSKYEGNNKSLIIECPFGHITKGMTFGNFKKGCRCCKCNKKEKYKLEEVKEYIESFGYKLLSTEYIKNDEPLLVQCNNGHQPYKVRFKNFKNGRRCPHCNDEHRHEYKKFSYEYVKEYIENFGYELLSNEYNGVYEKLLLECPIGHQYYVSFNSFKNNKTRCPKCNISKGEQRIINWLNNNNFQYIPQKMFNNLLGVGNGLLSYDFYLPDYNLLIEYQGEFHNGIANYQTEEQFKIQQEHDRRKREYAEKNNIKLLEIWYWDFDRIEDILNKELKML